MTRRVLIILVGALLVGGLAIWWVRRDPYAREVHRIQKRLAALAEAASFSPDEGLLNKVRYASRLSSFLSTNTHFSIAVGGETLEATLSRTEFEEVASRRMVAKGLNVEFLDVVAKPSEDLQEATAHLTARIRLSGDKEYIVQEFRIELRREEGEWLVAGLETVRTLEQ